MRKRQIISTLQSARPSDEVWLDLDHAALVEVTSEEEGYPIESALVGDNKRGWRAASKGNQTIRLIFDQPQRLKRIWLVFEERESRRTQEIVLRSSQDQGNSFREIVRQQWNFCPPDSIREIEDYGVDLYEVTQLELIIEPDKSGSDARASLANLRLG
jgi:hypothetical protein